MKFHLKQFADEATDWIYKDFTNARKKLVGIYLLIILGVISLFSILIIFQVNVEPTSSTTLSGDQIMITEKEARDIFAEKLPGVEIRKTEYELENGVLYFTIEYGDDRDFKVNLFTGDVINQEEDTNFWKMLVDDFDEKVLWIGLFVFLLASLVSMYVATKTLSPIARAIKKQNDFISGAAHELRNPLASLMSSFQSAIHIKEPVTEEFLHDMLTETKRLIKMTEALLSMEKSYTKKKELTQVSIASTISETIKRLQPQIAEKQISIEKNIEYTKLYIDQMDIECILYNILHNAIKFGKQEGTIVITWQNNVLTISDNGPGVSRDKIPFIFDRFYKGDDSRNSAGYGLGLAIVKEIAMYYKATLHVKSELKKGTEVSIKFKS